MFLKPPQHWILSVALSLSLVFSGCATAPKADRTVPFEGDHLAYNQANIALASPRNKVLWQYRAAGTALRRDQRDLAKTLLDDALATAALHYGQPNAAAAKSRSRTKSESEKTFIGEPYERVMANFYRALLYWSDGDLDNARALLRNAALIDSDTTDKTYAADYILLDYLDGLLTAKSAAATPDAGADSLARARLNATIQDRSEPPDYDLAANAHIIVEYGRAPCKDARGEYGERLDYYVRPTLIKQVRLLVDGETHELPAYDDLGYQATTRGLRAMDQILASKANFKKTTNDVGDTALVVPAAMARFFINNTDFTPSDSSATSFHTTKREDSKNNSSKTNKDSDGSKSAATVLIPVAIVVGSLIAIGMSARFLSRTTKAEADTRAWDNLPRYLCYKSLRLAPGAHAATLEFLDEDGKLVPLQKQTFTITIPAPATTFEPAFRDTIIFRSQLPD